MIDDESTARHQQERRLQFSARRILSLQNKFNIEDDQEMDHEKHQNDGDIGYEPRPTTASTPGGSHIAEPEQNSKYITGAKLYIILGCVTMVVFLVLMDVSVLSTVSTC